LISGSHWKRSLPTHAWNQGLWAVALRKLLFEVVYLGIKEEYITWRGKMYWWQRNNSCWGWNVRLYQQ